MPLPRLVLVLLVAGCGQGLDLAGLTDPAQASRRGAIEVAVKSAHPAIVSEIEAGGGPALARAFDAAGVPAGERAARTTQLGGDLGLYARNPGALAAALAVYGR